VYRVKISASDCSTTCIEHTLIGTKSWPLHQGDMCGELNLIISSGKVALAARGVDFLFCEPGVAIVITSQNEILRPENEEYLIRDVANIMLRTYFLRS
jgi:hypothetical protein